MAKTVDTGSGLRHKTSVDFGVNKLLPGNARREEWNIHNLLPHNPPSISWATNKGKDMKTKIISAVVAVVTTLAYQAEAQTYDTNNEVVQTFAGFGIPGYVDGDRKSTRLNSS